MNEVVTIKFPFKTGKERKQHTSNKMEGAENIYAAAAAGLIQQRKNGKTDNHLFPTMKNEDSDA